MLDPELLEIIVCPETKEELRLADEEFLNKVNRAIEAGELRTRGGETVRDTIDEGLVREDGRLLYPVRDDIPIMLIDEAFVIEDLP